MQSPLPVGTRISYLSHLGTVRFIGEVEGTRGIWLGIEWDDPRRGKHSGSKDGKEYFSCKVPNSGSFIRPSASVNVGRSFLEAISSKYIEEQSQAGVETVILGSSKGAIEVEAPGLNKVRSKLSRIENLKEVSLDKEYVAKANEAGQINQRCPNIKGLDLSRSLLPTWEELARITKELPKLETLALNYNRLETPISTENLHSAFRNIQELRLNGTLAAWSETMRLVPLFPALRHLELGFNNITNLEDPSMSIHESISYKLTVLNLEANFITDWISAMAALAQFPSLERLVLSENSIEHIPFPSNSTNALQQLNYLALTSNNVQSWSDIDALASWFPRLQTLNINSTPIVKESTSRPLIIAKLVTLTTLNSSAISSRERRDSELFYLTHIAKRGPASDTEREHAFPRYLELCEKYGKPMEQKENVHDTLKKHLLNVQLFQLTSGASPSMEVLHCSPPVTFGVLPTMSLKVFRLKALKTLKLPPLIRIQFWLALERGSIVDFAELDMSLSDRALDWWGVEDNCKIVYYLER